MTAVQRYDYSTIPSKLRRTPQGGVRVDAGIARTGVLLYTQADGSVRRELVLPEELFHADSIASLRDAPLTIGHPDMVSTANWQTHAVGHLPSARPDGQVLAAELVAQRQDAVDGIERRDLVETSCGYTCETEEVPGTWEGQEYDAIQRNRRYNHVGLGPRGWARAGAAASLRLDGSAWTATLDTDGSHQKEVPAMAVKFDGKTYDSAEAALAVAEVKVDSLQKELTGSQTSLATAVKTSEQLQAKVDSVTADLTKARADLAVATDPKRIDEQVAVRTALAVKASQVLGSAVKLDGKTAREIHALVIAKAKPTIKLDGRSDDYLEALFDDIVTSGFRADGIQGFHGALDDVTRQDASDPEMDKEEAEYEKKRRDRAKGDLTFTKGK